MDSFFFSFLGVRIQVHRMFHACPIDWKFNRGILFDLHNGIFLFQSVFA